MMPRKATTWRQRHPERMRELRANWRRANPDRAIAQGRASAARSTPRIKAELRAYVEAMKARPCMDCGNVFDPICMDFDHRPGETKTGNVSQIRVLDDVKAEIAKCDVVCSNCHRLRTKSRGQWGPKRLPSMTDEPRQLSLLDERKP